MSDGLFLEYCWAIGDEHTSSRLVQHAAGRHANPRLLTPMIATIPTHIRPSALAKLRSLKNNATAHPEASFRIFTIRSLGVVSSSHSIEED